MCASKQTKDQLDPESRKLQPVDVSGKTNGWKQVEMR